MKIAIRNGEGGGWKEMSTNEQPLNGSLQELIHEIPELISVEDLEPGKPSMKVCIKNLSAGSGDDGGLIGIDDSGRITIVECNAASASINRREIVGQALEYAATLWEMSYEDFDTMVVGSEGKSLAKLMGERVPEEEWSEETFKSAVTSALHQGKFRLIMTIQGMTDELKRTIKFLSARGPFSFETYAVQMYVFTEGEMEIVIPRITSFAEAEQMVSVAAVSSAPVSEAVTDSAPAYEEVETETLTPAEPTIAKIEEAESSDSPEPAIGQNVSADQVDKTDKNDKRKEALFFAKCQDNISQKAVETIRKIYVFSMDAADSIMWWGAGGAGAFNFVLTEEQLTVFIVDANGRIMFNFSEWQREPTYKSLLPQFIEKLKDITVLRRQKGDYTKWPDFGIEEFFANQNDFERFEQAVLFLKEELSKLVVV